MSGRYFLDTNILAYCFDETAPEKRERANQLVREGLERRVGVISYQVLQEFINLALRRFEPRMGVDDVRQYAAVVLRPMLAVGSSMALYQRALEIVERYRFSWYDSLIVASALESRCEVLYSEDLQHKQRIESLEIVNPFL
jgi:predicted nucleic acid-binding protein